MSEPRPLALVDVEALLIAWLGADDDLTAVLGADRVSSELPATFADAGEKWLQVFRATATTVDPETSYIERAVLQVNAYGATKAEAWDVFAEAFVAIIFARTGTHPGAVVTNVERLSGPTWSKDPSNDSPRYTSSFALTVHPS